MVITYESIKPLIKSESLEGGNQMKVSFQAEGMAAPIQAVGMMMADQDEMMKNVKKQAVKQGIMSSIISSASSFLGGLIGGVGGRAASSAASTAAYSMTSSSSMGQDMMNAKDTPENRQKAVVAAFQTVQTYFEYDSTNGTWKGKDMSKVAQG
ncbi:hypothetical protein [Parvicella tangerina]|uniref:Uncharacterized protein n=1 Tax=Parvicella tangerina TaxID=2829795 RepID=A0A916JNL5_9FLAO|nr:hypothetical protein [Parvicella tangerina]CAG5083158.1 hypothetical protein CRYO30217_02106 [Parvicella tangerina]